MNSKENTCARISFLIKLQAKVYNFIKKETLTQVLCCQFCEISKNTFFTEHLWATASENKTLTSLKMFWLNHIFTFWKATWVCWTKTLLAFLFSLRVYLPKKWQKNIILLVSNICSKKKSWWKSFKSVPYTYLI